MTDPQDIWRKDAGVGPLQVVNGLLFYQIQGSTVMRAEDLECPFWIPSAYYGNQPDIFLADALRFGYTLVRTSDPDLQVDEGL